MDKQKMNEFSNRWTVDPVFKFLMNYIFDLDMQPTGMSRHDWYLQVAPKTFHPTLDKLTFDCRGLILHDREIGDVWLNYVVDESCFTACVFSRTHLQSISAQYCDFSESQFLSAQMSPFYARGSIFRNCQFVSCYAQGQMPRYHKDVHGILRKGTYSDFRNCDFSNVRAQKTGFDRCDFRNTDFAGAQFERCIFSESDLRGIVANNTQFKDCDFQCAMIDDTPAWRIALNTHVNLNTEKIVWTASQS
jgi:uncharacterized protein YjbI with pentapeptide repeats